MQSAFFPQQQQSQHQPAGALPSPASASHTGRKATVTHTGSPVRHAAPGSISQTAAGSRALRFPSSRRYLWDKTAAGPQVLIDALDYLPHVQVAASAFGAISKASSNKDSSVLLQLGLSVNSSNQVTALIQEHDPLSAQGALQLSCSMTQPGAAAADAANSLRATLQAHVDQRDIARVQQLYALSASATAAASPADLTSLRLQLLLPRAGLLATPLYTKRLCHVPLAEALLKPGCMAAGQTGHLSMDQARSLLPMEATDANVYSTPLVGVWVKGPSSVLHPLVTAACLRFAYSSLLMDRAVSPDDGAFLLLLCPEGDPVSKCFEVQVTDNSKLELCCYRLEAGVRPAAGLSQYPGGLVSATWVPDQRQVQPLPGALTAAGASSTLQASAGGYSHSKAASAAGTPARAAAGYMHRNLREPSPFAADSPVLYGHSHASRAAELQLGRSSAPSAAFGAAGQLQQGAAAAAAAARRSLPLTYYGDSYSRGDAAVAAAERPWEPYAAAGLPPFGYEGPQPRSGVPGAPYVPSAQGQGSSRPSWQQQPQQPQQEVAEAWAVAAYAAGAADVVSAAAEAFAGAGGDVGPRSTNSSPTKGSRQQQLTWSDRQDQVLRKSLEGAAEALRSSQACLAAAREAATGAGSRLSSPTKVRSAMGEGTFSTATGHPDAPDGTGGSGQSPVTAGVAGAGLCGSPQPGLSRLGQQQHAEGDAESDCGPRMGSPVRTQQLQKKASMLAAAAAHAAGIGAASASQDAAGDERPVSPVVQAGLALSNLSLLQHLSAGQLQQQGYGLEAVGNAAVAAAAGSPVGAGRSYAQQQQQQQQELSTEVPAGAGTHAFAPPAAASTGSAVADSYNASQGAAAAIRAATSSMQRVPVHPYNAQSLGVQRYAADVAVMRSSHGSPGGMGLMSPGSSPGMYDSSAARWQPLQQQQQQQEPGNAQLPSAWSPGMMSAATPGAVGPSGSNRKGSPYWQQQQQYGVQQVSPVSAGLSPGWAPDPVAQALQGEVDRLRQQLQQLQQQLRLAGMALPNPDLDTASGAATPAAQGASAAATPQPQPAAPPAPAVTPAAAPAAGGSPMIMRDGGVHINVYLRPGDRSPQVHMHEQQDAARAAAEQAWQQAGLPAPSVPLQQQQLERPAQRYPTVSYAGAAAEAPQGSAAAAAVPAAEASLAEASPLQQQSAYELAPTEASTGAVASTAVAEGAPTPDAQTQAAAAADAAEQQQAAASAARQRRRKLDFEAAAAAAAAAAENVATDAAAQHPADSDGCSSTGSDGAQQGAAAQTVTAADAPGAAAAAAAPPPAAALPVCAAAEDASSAAVSQPVVCSSPAIRHTAGAAAAKATPRHPADAVPAAAPAATTAAAGGSGVGGVRASAAGSTAGMRYSVACSSVPRSSGGGLGHLRSSLDAPPLVEVVRTRVVDLSDDSDSDEWEDRLLVKYGLK